ncbi:hypothetical protein [Actinomadura parmotrematis]|uniref:GGDEF domain-containing protein n=1 Tax=Actinomadura parmotrematis TaxID=2864039 RepID=A0ABS7FQH9_9ACTN|nr:hypothetical protein [Actinomadura parmotrematis]MBW8481989.1 hypothetical protein [Actinomadura parmotrematis]
MAYLWSGPRPGGRPEPRPDDLRERWRTRSAGGGWSLPADWWTPAVETVVSAVCQGEGMGVACVRLGRARGRAGVGIGETLDDLGALFAELRWPDPPLTLVRCAAEGWVEAGLPPPAATCEDPLTGLMTPAYLGSRLTELYRTAAALGGAPGTAAADTHALMLVELPGGLEPWRRLARAVVVGHELRALFQGGETLALLGSGRVAALVPAGLDRPVAEVRRALALAVGETDLVVRSEPMPATLPAALDLVRTP